MKNKMTDPRTTEMLRVCDIMLGVPEIKSSLPRLREIHRIKQDATVAKDNAAFEAIMESWTAFFVQLPPHVVSAYEVLRDRGGNEANV